MKISGIDKDFVNIIKYLDEKGFKPFSSCDGVEDNHKDKNSVGVAYIAFLKNPQIIDLMAAFLRDRNNFLVIFSNPTHREPMELYGNMIEGNTYSVNFQNSIGETTAYFEKIIKGVVEGRINITDTEKERLIQLDDVLENEGNSDLNFSVAFNSGYQPYMNKPGKNINVLTICSKEGKLNGTSSLPKEGYTYFRDMTVLADRLAEQYGMPKKTFSPQENFDEEEFVVCMDSSTCQVYFGDEHFDQVLEQIKFARSIGDSLPIKESLDPDFIEWDEDEPEYI